MIPKQQILELAQHLSLQPTTVEKDYALGWLLIGISRHDVLSKWAFKGGTCLKKCFFETYRFSEDLDFTVPSDLILSESAIKRWLGEVAEALEPLVGLQFPRDRIHVEIYKNPRNNESVQAKITYIGPLGLAKYSLQRVKFDLTQDELLANDTERRELFHPFVDSPQPPSRVRCYSVDEILAEKARALHERSGRARDVYDIVHISREFKDTINAANAADIARRKFAFKKLDPPTVASIMARVGSASLEAAWEQQLRHQLPHLPPVGSFLADLHGALAWWLEPESAPAELPAIAIQPNEQPVRREWFPTNSEFQTPTRLGATAPRMFGSSLDRIRFAARNRLCARVAYQGVLRLVEPYSLRQAAAGPLLLYIHELDRGGLPTNAIEAFKVAEIQDAKITDQVFRPRFRVEL